MLDFKDMLNALDITGVVDTTDKDMMEHLEKLYLKAGKEIEWIVSNQRELSFSLWLLENADFADLVGSLTAIESFDCNIFDPRKATFVQRFRENHDCYQKEVAKSLLWKAQDFDTALKDFVSAADQAVSSYLDFRSTMV